MVFKANICGVHGCFHVAAGLCMIKKILQAFQQSMFKNIFKTIQFLGELSLHLVVLPELLIEIYILLTGKEALTITTKG